MRRGVKTVAAWLTAALLAGLLAEAAVASHGSCSDCHVGGLPQPGERIADPTSLCLSCHDGTMAVNEVISPPGAREGRLSSDHPVEISVPQLPNYQRLEVIRLDLPLKDGTTLTCITCHDPHDSRSLPGSLRVSNERSGLCFRCHLV
ncbi:MAG: cytochrome c3 family protein [Bacillota bacterium]|nr:cytochrome c3 family protein [Bacillota bacterium]